MLRIIMNDEGAMEELSATGTLVDLAAGISTAITFAYVVLHETQPDAAREFREMVLRCVKSEDMWDAEEMRPHIDKSVCAIHIKAEGDDNRDGV